MKAFHSDLYRRKVMVVRNDHHQVIGLWGSRCSSVNDETVTCPFDLWEEIMINSIVYIELTLPLSRDCLFVVSVYETSLIQQMLKQWIITEKKTFNYSERWITRLANRWRAQQSAITIVNCRIYWAAITWTQIAVSGIPETTFAWGSKIQHEKCNIIAIVYYDYCWLGLWSTRISYRMIATSS